MNIFAKEWVQINDPSWPRRVAQEPGVLLGGPRIGDERYKRQQTAGYRSTGGEPCGCAGGKIGSGYEFKFNKVRNTIFHDHAPVLSHE